ncbi:hypothetical protein GOP47_0008477 [Adiantum capillus-veneris]|uniref:Uncharacterized protein n=1 Tax=Adiantum capillus-veneris TaxID=13818 RepID=A0A9D4UZ59_ADICA|nr:hypothetical protein GOP47_0008477 [Adiantum capillus-veneris]
MDWRVSRAWGGPCGHVWAASVQAKESEVCKPRRVESCCGEAVQLGSSARNFIHLGYLLNVLVMDWKRWR